MKSDEPITPKASQRIIDGEVVNDVQADAKSSSPSSASSAKKNSQWLPRTFIQKMVLVLLLVLLGLGSFWVWQSNQQDWQIEHINQLQSQQKALKANIQTLQNRLDAQAKQLAQLDSTARTPAFSQADLDQIQDDINTLKEQAKSEIAQLSESLSSLSERFKQSSAAAVTSMMPSEQQQQKTQKMLETLKAQVSELFEFKTEQQTDLEPVQQNEVVASAPVLTDQQRQQWVAQINTSWMLGSDLSSTQQQLKALEQAAALSDWPEKNKVLRQIGEDWAQLNQQQDAVSKRTQAKQAIEKLKAEIQNRARVETHLQPRPSTQAAQTGEAAMDDAPPLSAWQQLVTKIQALFSIQKRDSAEDLSQVQQLIHRDVLLQRALLHIERMDWALELGSISQLSDAKQSLSAFISKSFAQDQTLDDLLAQIDPASLTARQPLKIAGGQ